MRIKMLLATAAVAGAGLIVGGCGGDDDTADATTASITKAEWIARADAICTEGNTRVAREAGERFAGLEPGSPAFERAHARLLPEVALPDLRDQVTRIAALDMPRGDEGQIDAIVAAVRAGIDESEADPAAFDAPDGSLAEAAKLIGAYGSKVCSAG